MSEEQYANGAAITYTVKEMLALMDSKLDTKLSALDSKLEVTLSKLEDKADRTRVHDLASAVTTKAALVDLKETDRRVDKLEDFRATASGAMAVGGIALTTLTALVASHIL